MNEREITEADVVRFLQARAAQLAEATGERFTSVRVEVWNAEVGRASEWGAYTHSGARYERGDRLDSALDKAALAAQEASARKNL